MRPADNVEEAIRKKLNFAASTKLHDRLLDDVLNAQEKSQKTESAFTLLKIRRTIMKSPITKLAAAAMMVGAVMLSMHLWDKSTPSAYAFEQTVEAMKGKRSFHIQTYFQQRRKDEFWAQFDEEGKLVRFRQEEDGGPKGPMITLWEDKIMNRYHPSCGVH